MVTYEVCGTLSLELKVVQILAQYTNIFDSNLKVYRGFIGCTILGSTSSILVKIILLIFYDKLESTPLNLPLLPMSF